VVHSPGDLKLLFDLTNNRCKQKPDVCDSSLVTGGIVQQTTTNGCDNITRTGDDSAWGSYDADCVSNTPNLPVSLNGLAYDSACCYAYTIDTFDVYDNNLNSETSTNGVRIY